MTQIRYSRELFSSFSGERSHSQFQHNQAMCDRTFECARGDQAVQRGWRVSPIMKFL